MHVAVVGGGIAGLACAYYMRGRAHVTLYEQAPRLGGHVHAVHVPGCETPVETGFLAFHRSKYPELVALFSSFGVETAPSGTGLGIWDEESGWCAGSEAWFERLPRPPLADLVKRVVRHERAPVPNVRLDAWLAELGYDGAIARHVLWPSIAALWGFQPAEVMAMSAQTVADMLGRFFVTAHEEPFERVAPSTDAWLAKLIGSLDAELRLGQSVRAIDGTSVDGTAYDAVVVATHADTALTLLASPTSLQRELLGAFPYNRTTSVVHTDRSVLPAEPRTDYNYRLHGGAAYTTWDMQRIQGLGAEVFVTVGPRGFTGLIDPAHELARLDYAHPASPPEAVTARERLPELNGAGQYFCGSYFGSTGSNECAVASAKRACAALLGVAP